MPDTRRLQPVLRVGQHTSQTREFRIVDPDGDPVDVSDADVTLTMEHDRLAYTAINGEPVTIVDGVGGFVEYDFSTEETSLEGRYRVQFEVTYSDGETALYPPDDHTWMLDVGRRIPETQPLSVPSVSAAEGTYDSLQVGSIEIEQASISEVVGDPDISDLSIDSLDVDALTGGIVGTRGPLVRLDGPDLQINANGELEWVDPNTGDYTAGSDHDHSATGSGGDTIRPSVVGTDTDRVDSMHAAATDVTESTIGTATIDDATINERRVAPDTTRTVTVPGDYATIQDAVYAVIGIVQRANDVTISIADGTYSEDVLIPPFLSEGDGSERDFPDSTLQLIGDDATPSNVQVSSLTALNSHGRSNPIVRGVEFTGATNPYSGADYTIESGGAQDLSIRSCSFTTDVTRAARAYGGGLDIRGCDIGTENVNTFVEAKRDGYVVAQDNTGDATNYAYRTEGGTIHVLSTDAVGGERQNFRGSLHDASTDQVYSPDGATHNVEEINVENSALASSVTPGAWYNSNDGSGRYVSRSQNLTEGVPGDATPTSLIAYQDRRHGLFVVMGSAQASADRFTDLVLLADRVGFSVVGSAARGTPGARTYSEGNGDVQVAIDDAGATYDVVVAAVGGRPYV